MLRFGAYEIDSGNQEIIVNGKNAGLTQKEFALACYLFQNQNKLLSRIHLLEKIWGLAAEIDTRTVDTHISRLRNKLHFSLHSNWDILTIYGYGYCLSMSKFLSQLNDRRNPMHFRHNILINYYQPAIISFQKTRTPP